MESSEPSIQNDWCPCKEKRHRDRGTQRKDSHVTIGAETAVMLERGQGGPFPGAFEKNTAQQKLCSWTSGLQNREMIHFYCFKSPIAWYFLTASLANSHTIQENYI